MPSPDLEGYKDAQARLRANFGQAVPFFIPTPTVWPPGVPTDENGVPLDPEVAPLASGFVTASGRCNVTSRPIVRTLEMPTTASPIGLKDRSRLVLIADHDEFVANGLDAAVMAEVFERRYKIEAIESDQVGPGKIQRKLVFVEKM